MTINEWKKLNYLSPEKILIGLHNIALELPLEELPYKTASLRTKDLKKYGEGRQCALFCYLVGKAFGLNIDFAQYEKSDYDCIARYIKNNIATFVPVQMKELVPAHVNPNSDLQIQINKLKKYQDSNDLVVAIFLNKVVNIKLSDLKIPELNIAQLWLFGSNDLTQTKWTLIGDLLKPNPCFFEIDYPCR